MLILPKPAKDEFALGFIGRLCHVNLVKSYFEMMRALLVHYQLESAAGAHLKALAGVSNMDIGDFAFSHTLFPLIVSDCKTYNGWGTKRCISGKRNPLRLVKKYAYFCPDCINQQRLDVGYPYWNRIHQLPGIYWCHWHRTPLLKSNEFIIQKKLPSIDDALFDSSLSLVNRDINHPMLQRYSEIMVRLLSHSASRSWLKLALLVRSGATKDGIQIDKNQLTRRYLSDIAFDSYPVWWLERVFPFSHEHKSPGKYFKPIDGALLSNKWFDTPAYALAIALMAESKSQNVFN